MTLAADGIWDRLTKKIVSVPFICLSSGRFFPIPCAKRPNSFVSDLVQVALSRPSNSMSSDCFTPVSAWNTGHAHCGGWGCSTTDCAWNPVCRERAWLTNRFNRDCVGRSLLKALLCVIGSCRRDLVYICCLRGFNVFSKLAVF